MEMLGLFVLAYACLLFQGFWCDATGQRRLIRCHVLLEAAVAWFIYRDQYLFAEPTPFRYQVHGAMAVLCFIVGMLPLPKKKIE